MPSHQDDVVGVTDDDRDRQVDEERTWRAGRIDEPAAARLQLAGYFHETYADEPSLQGL